ncbi:hypothetical protein E0Z10_g6809 [Xylaria hypoxylon]|uniref:Uncharacterized protein n=1 Tax=Xylaria hypoxylon TaxID=37992 RepID=A0A4Z0YZU2_9PEZI|nr:hypothetical protein E0Z10_g6809 [Xylaria hypoxylon]
MFRPVIHPFSTKTMKAFLTLNAPRPTIPTAKGQYARTKYWAAFPEEVRKPPEEQDTTPLSHHSPFEFESKIQRQLLWATYGPWNWLAGPRAPIAPKNPRPVTFQDVRGRGPLFNLSKIELDADPEQAKQQWRKLCVEYDLKQEVATTLWEENRELEIRCGIVVAECKMIQERHNSVTRIWRELDADNQRLCEEIKRAQNMIPAPQRNAMKLDVEFDELSMWSRNKPAERRRIAQRNIRRRYWTRLFGLGLGLLSITFWYSMIYC